MKTHRIIMQTTNVYLPSYDRFEEGREYLAIPALNLPDVNPDNPDRWFVFMADENSTSHLVSSSDLYVIEPDDERYN